ncbi:MAG TPA: hemerythrin domain-containing protein [Streptosporangiaceae bacterium]
MGIESLAAALEHEHREIDEGIEAFTAGPQDRRDTGALTRAIHALRRHIYLEEEFLFPPLHAAGLVAPVFVMLREHAQIWTTLDALEREIGAAEGTARALCHQLAVQLQHHNLKEEKILYPQADQVLTARAGARLRAFIDSGRLPDGWVCLKARS